MSKKKKILLIVSIIIFVIGLITFIIIYNSKKTEVQIDSKFSVTLIVNRSEKIKEIKYNNKDAKKLDLEKIKNKKIGEASKIIVNAAIDKKILNPEAYSYNVVVTIDSEDSELVKDYKTQITSGAKGKLKNNAFIELVYENCSCEIKACSRSC